MTAIAGAVSPGGRNSSGATQRLLEELSRYGGSHRSTESLGPAAFGRGLHGFLDQGSLDAQPFLDPDRRQLFVADCRLDDPGELAAVLGTEFRERSTDNQLLYAAWQKWGEATVEKVHGDFAFAVWDDRRHSLTLGRSPLASKPLFAATYPGGCYFASLPAALLALDPVETGLTLDVLAAIIVNVTPPLGSYLYSGVVPVPPGAVMVWREGRLETRQLWRLDPEPAPIATFKQAAEAYEEVLVRAVTARLRRENGGVASELSSGRDSSAVTAMAARILAGRGESLIAYTHAPPSGFETGHEPTRLADESPVAAATAALYPNIEHRVLRSDGLANPMLMSEWARAANFPIRNPSNMDWEQNILRDASRAGASVLLTGALGNFTVSAGGPVALNDVFIEDGLCAWLSRAHKAGRLKPGSMLSLLDGLAIAVLPAEARTTLRVAADRLRFGRYDLSILSPAMQRAVAPMAKTMMRRLVQPYAAFRHAALADRDLASGFSVSYAGIDERDPTADRQVVELSQALRSRFLVEGPQARPIYDQVFAGKVDPRVLRPTRRGLQGANWFQRWSPNSLKDALHLFAEQPEFRALVSIPAISKALDAWPRGPTYTGRDYELYCAKTLTAISVGAFIHQLRTGR